MAECVSVKRPDDKAKREQKAERQRAHVQYEPAEIHLHHVCVCVDERGEKKVHKSRAGRGAVMTSTAASASARRSGKQSSLTRAGAWRVAVRSRPHVIRCPRASLSTAQEEVRATLREATDPQSSQKHACRAACRWRDATVPCAFAFLAPRAIEHYTPTCNTLPSTLTPHPHAKTNTHTHTDRNAGLGGLPPHVASAKERKEEERGWRASSPPPLPTHTWSSAAARRLRPRDEKSRSPLRSPPP